MFEKPEVLILLLLLLVIVFGAKKVPEIARSLGRSSSEFKKGLKEGASDTTPAAEEEKKPSDPSTNQTS
jgi:sec-independent protein translocase protein TatA